MIIVIVSIILCLLYGFIAFIKTSKSMAIITVDMLILLISCSSRETAICGLIACAIVDAIICVLIPKSRWKLEEHERNVNQHIYQTKKEEKEHNDWGFIDFSQK